MVNRPDYIKCVRHTHAEKLGTAWCGRDIRFEFSFIDINHAAYARMNDDRLLVCPECAQEIVKLFTERNPI